MRITTYTTVLDEDQKNILVKEKSVNYESEVLRKPERIAKMMCDVFSLHQQTEEYLYMIAFNTKCKVLGVFEISHGTVNSSPLGVRELFIRLLLCGGVSFVLVHNHPSGDTTPSDDDLRCTKRLKKAATIMGVDFLDHLVIGEKYNYYSFGEHNLI